MNAKRIFHISAFVFALVLLAASLSACEMPASEGPAPITPDFVIPEDTLAAPDFNLPGTETAQPEATQPEATQPPPEVTQPPAVTPTSPVVIQPTQAVVEQQPQAQPTYVEATPGIPASYTLQAGEFPFCIARRFDVDQYALLSVNGLNLWSQVQPGTKLTIPQNSSGFSGDRSLINHPDEYIVKAGDTIFSIACAYGDVSPDMIALQNGLTAPYNLQVGQELIIP